MLVQGRPARLQPALDNETLESLVPEDVPPLSWPSVEPSAVSDELNLDDWIDGTCGLTRAARVFQRGDLITRLDAIEKEIEITGKIPKDQRGINDKSPEQLQAEWDQVAADLMQSAMTFHVQDRTEERREKIRKRLVQELGADDSAPEKMSFEHRETINIHVIADAIIKVEAGGKTKSFPDGFPPNKLRDINERLGDAALGELWTAFRRVTMEAPTISAPLSRRTSSARGGVT